MDSYSAPALNSTSQDEARPRLPRAAIIAGVCLFMILVGAGVFLMLNSGDTQSLDETAEPTLEYSSEGSRLLSLDRLLDYGLTREQYEKVCVAIESALDRGDRDSKYFDYIYDSFTVGKATTAATSDTITEAERQAILAAISGNDHTAEKYGPEGDAASSETHADKEQLGLISFQLVSDTGKTYTVQFNAALGTKDPGVVVKDSEGKTL